MIAATRTSSRDFFASQLWRDCWWDPALFMVAIDRVTPHPWHFESAQRLTQNLRDGMMHNQLVWKKNRGCGGTFGLVEFSRWFLATRRDAKGVDTAPSWRHVESMFWPEMRARHKASLLGQLGFGEMGKYRWEIEPNWFMEGVATDQDVNAEGFHSPTAMLIAYDECKGIRDEVFQSLTGTLTSPETLRIYASTPGFEQGFFFDLWSRAASEGCIKIDVSGARALAEGIDGMEFLEREIREAWGEDSDTYRAHWMAEFLRTRRGGIIQWADVEAAMQRHDAILAGKIKVEGRHHSSLDIAASDDGNKSVLGNFIGDDLIEVHSWQIKNTREMEREAFALAKAWESDRLRGDAPGLGRPVIQGLEEAAKKHAPKMKVQEYLGGNAPAEKGSLYANRHTEAVNLLAKKLRQKRTALPRRDSRGEMIPWKQLLQYHQKATDDAKYRVEKASKGEESPDFGDMVAIGLALDIRTEMDSALEFYRRRRTQLTAEGRV